MDYPSRPKYVEQFRDMAQKIASLQEPDGLWRSVLPDEEAYPVPELFGMRILYLRDRLGSQSRGSGWQSV